MKNSKTSIISSNKKKYRPTTALKLEKSNPQVSDSEIGQLERKTLGGDLQTLNYQYNIRGWLTQTNDPNKIGKDLFAFSLDYLANGNIDKTKWSHWGESVQSYAYSYDELNRLKKATHSSGNYDMTASYDKNGNISTLSRMGVTDNSGKMGMMDQLGYSYTGNQLTGISEQGSNAKGFTSKTTASSQFSYDVNGNMIQDLNKGISSINYNHLNLPKRISINGSSIDYTYDASGVKLKKQVNGQTTEYSGSAVYTNGNLEFIHMPEGYIEPIDAGYQFVYRITDHLGNTRVSFKKNVVTKGLDVLATNDYYPFGLEHNKAGTTVESSNLGQRYKFNGVG